MDYELLNDLNKEKEEIRDNIKKSFMDDFHQRIILKNKNICINTEGFSYLAELMFEKGANWMYKRLTDKIHEENI